MIPKIYKKGADILFDAITNRNTKDAIALLEKQEVDPNAVNINGRTPLHLAVEA